MKKIPRSISIWIRPLHSSACRSLASRPLTLEPSIDQQANLEAFRVQAFIPQKPLVFKRGPASPASELPAASRWFVEAWDASENEAASWRFAPYMDQFQEWPFPYELVTSSPGKQKSVVAFRDWLSSSSDETDQVLGSILEPTIAELNQGRFFQLCAPLRLLMKALEFNKSNQDDGSRLLELYIAQSSLPDLPSPLQDDLPTPAAVRQVGKGDVYSSSIWLGTEPTYTPLHRDPNPNVFCQLHSHKFIRLMPPAAGDRLFFGVQRKIRQQANSRIRTVGMMEGKEREVLHEAVWERDPPVDGMVEAELGPGDSLFIPNGWWHSVKSKGARGQLNGSVNWWFR